MKISSKGLLIIAVLLSLITSALVYKYLQGMTAKTSKDGTPVIVAKVDIPPKTKITAEMLSQSKVPNEYLQPGSMSEMQLVVGTITRDHIIAGEQITERRLVIEGKTVGFSGVIPRDKRAITIAVTEVTGVAGFVKPGDYVDVVATFDQNMAGDNVSQIMMQNVLVLAANRDAETTANANKDNKKEVVKTSTVTLAVTPDEVAQLTLAEDKGKVRLALRPYMPANGFNIVNTVTPKDIVGAHAAPVDNRQRQDAVETPPKQNQKGPDESGIQMIRGTKVDTIPVH